MKIEYKTQNGTLYFVKAPDDANCFTIEHGRLCFNDKDNMPDYAILNKYGLTPEKGQDDYEFWELARKWQIEQNEINNLQLIGLTSEVTEEIAKKFFKPCYEGVSFDLYYLIDSKTKVNHALESFKSLMQHLQVYEFNPYGKERPRCSNYSSLVQYLGDAKDFDKAQDNCGKWIVLFKPNEK